MAHAPSRASPRGARRTCRAACRFPHRANLINKQAPGKTRDAHDMDCFLTIQPKRR
jgi:hypothetical protein